MKYNITLTYISYIKTSKKLWLKGYKLVIKKVLYEDCEEMF